MTDGPPSPAAALEKAGWQPIQHTASRDVFVVGYPKSGNTWYQCLVSGLVFGCNPALTPDHVIQELVPDVHRQEYFQRAGQRAFFKSHHLPRPDYRNVIYLLRDGRDVMVSYFHHLTALRGTSVDFATMVQEGRGLFPGKWHDHVTAWMANPFGARFMVVRYEDLKRDCLNEVHRLCEFLGMTCEESWLRLLANGTEFGQMQKREAALGWANAAWPKDRTFVRRGVVGSYRDEMPTAVLECFLKEAGPTLVRHGYLLDDALNRPVAALSHRRSVYLIRTTPRATESKGAKKLAGVSVGRDESDFGDALGVVRPYTMLSEERLLSLYRLAKKICQDNAPGNFVECGVAAGGSSALLAYVAKRHSRAPRVVYACDSFEGLPAPTVEDHHNGTPAEAAGWGAGACAAPESSLHEVCAKLGVTEFVKPVKGVFKQALPQHRDSFGPIALLHLDGDWYESTRDILNSLYDRVAKDGVIQVDDYGFWAGCKQALHEFERHRGLAFPLQTIDSTGVWFRKPDHAELENE